jgi:hypothetical protein
MASPAQKGAASINYTRFASAAAGATDRFTLRADMSLFASDTFADNIFKF